MTQPEATVVIAFYRNDATLAEQLEALATQQDAPAFEVVIADNEHSSTLPGLVLPFKGRLDLRIIRADQSRGQSHARNVGVEASRTDMVLFCDADDIVGPRWVTGLYRAISEADVLATGPLRVDRINPEIVWRAYLSAGEGAEKVQAQLVRPFTFLGYLPLVIGCSMAMRRGTYRRVGGLDRSMLGGSEDADLAWRVQEAGLDIVCVEEAVADYRLRAGISQIFRQRRQYEKSKTRLWVRSRRLGRPVRGMSLRWAVTESLKLVPKWLRSRNASDDVRYVQAFRAGAIIGNLESQVTMRFLGRGGARTTPGKAIVVFMYGILSGGGAERYALGMAAALRDMVEAGRLEGTVVLATDAGSREQFERHFGIDLRGIRVAIVPGMPGLLQRLPPSLFTLVKDLRWTAALRRLRPALFVNCLYRSELPGLGTDTSLYVCHFPHLLDPHAHGEGSVPSRIIRRLRRILLTDGGSFLDTYDTIIANSAFTQYHAQKRWARQVQVLYPPCPPMLVANVPRQRRILAVGRFEEPVPGVPNKRLDALVQAFTGMTDLHALGWQLHVAGACPDRSKDYLERLRAISAGAPVHFHPNVGYADLQRLYSSATIYWHAQGYGENPDAHPETQEHFGITTVEAMSAGVIPVVIDTAGPREVAHEVAGLKRWRSIPELISITRDLTALDETRRREIAEACRERSSCFSPAAFERSLASILDRQDR